MYVCLILMCLSTLYVRMMNIYTVYVVMLFYMPLARHLVMLRVYWMIPGHLQIIQCIMDSILLRFEYVYINLCIYTNFRFVMLFAYSKCMFTLF